MFVWKEVRRRFGLCLSCPSHTNNLLSSSINKLSSPNFDHPFPHLLPPLGSSLRNKMMIHCERGTVSVGEEMVAGQKKVVCPKPIRMGVLHSVVPSRAFRCHQNDNTESAARTDLLDILLKGSGSQDLEPFCTQVDSSPPFFSGSPPSRVSNPLIQDARFMEEKTVSPLVSQLPFPITGPNSPSSFTRKGGYTRNNFGNNPAVRVEGFDAMYRDGRNSAVSARA